MGSEAEVTVSFRVPRDVYERYRSLPPEKRREVYKAVQGFIVALLRGEPPPEGRVVYNIRVEACRERRTVKGVEKLYIYVVEALRTVRALRTGATPLPKVVRELRKVLVAVALNAVDSKVEAYLRETKRSFRKLIEMYVERRENVEEAGKVLEEIEGQLYQLHQYLTSKYPVF